MQNVLYKGWYLNNRNLRIALFQFFLCNIIYQLAAEVSQGWISIDWTCDIVYKTMKKHLGMRNIPVWLFKEFYQWNLEETLRIRSIVINEKVNGVFRNIQEFYKESDKIWYNSIDSCKSLYYSLLKFYPTYGPKYNKTPRIKGMKNILTCPKCNKIVSMREEYCKSMQDFDSIFIFSSEERSFINSMMESKNGRNINQKSRIRKSY